ncbi:MAG: YbaN family protein [Candidatus Bathyarchaeota archaeon]|nr:YbaN family protein [Candidatus Bathyarchaeota archaeon]
MNKKNTKGKKLFRLKPVSNRLLSSLLIIAGTFFVVLGIIGIALPILPTTPFLIIAAACYAKGSKRFYNWLVNNRLLGRYIKNYLENKGISMKAKIISISLLWATIIFSITLIIQILLIRIILIIVAIIITYHIISIKTIEK